MTISTTSTHSHSVFFFFLWPVRAFLRGLAHVLGRLRRWRSLSSTAAPGPSDYDSGTQIKPAPIR